MLSSLFSISISLTLGKHFFNKELNFLWNRTIFSWNTSFYQSKLTWLHLVYGKILFFARHPLLMVYVECFPIIILDNCQQD